MTLVSCSTPYGIRGKSTLPYPGYWELEKGAQRLTASEVKAHKSFGIVTVAGIRAQRLTASEVKAQGTTIVWLSSLFICSTPYGIRGKSTRART